MNKQYDKRIRSAWRRPGSVNIHRFTQNDTKNINLENGIHGFWFKKFPHSRQTSTRNEQMPTRSTRTRMGDQRKDHIDPEGPPKESRPKQLQTYNLPTDDVENINSTNKGRDLLLANKLRIVPWRTERMPQRIQKHRRVSLHRSAHPKWEQDQTEKFSNGMDWLLKGMWFSPAKLDNNCLKMYKISHEVINFIEKKWN